MSLSTSTKPIVAPIRALSPASFQQTLTKSQSKSEQLARAVAESQASPQIPYRPDSTWSEGGADVIWNGAGADKGRFDSDLFASSALPSPAANSSHTVFSSNTDSEFADANEGNRSEDDWDEANTTMTTVSTADSRKGLNAYPPLNSTPILKAAPPARPKKRAPARLLEQATLAGEAPLSGGEEDLDADTDLDAGSDRNSRTSSVGSSIWAGRGSRKAEDAPPMPAAYPSRHAALLQENTAFSNISKFRQSTASSVYSQNQSPAMEWEDSPRLEQGEEKENAGVLHGRENEDGKRRLADGTIVPKMPPMPGFQQDGSTQVPLPRSRSKKGRQNRSPVLSYADGAEEEERLEREREIQEHGASRGLEVTSTMGPKLKKNSPAPWEMADEREEGDFQAARSSHELFGISSRPSTEHLVPPNPRFGSSWARQSVESFRNRSTSNGSHSHQNNYPPMPSSLKPAAALPSKEQMTNSVETLSDGTVLDQATVTTRRSRAKSVSSGAVGVLKGLGLTSSSATSVASSTSKKGGKFGKALRGIGTGTRSSSASSNSGSIEGKKIQGISSDDYAHLPPSPLPDHRFDVNYPVDGRGMSTSASKATLTPDGIARQRIASSTMLPTLSRDRQSSSNDSHTGTSMSNATNASSQYTAMSSPGLPMENKGDSTDLTTTTGGKYRDPSHNPSPKKAGKTTSLSVEPTSSIPSSYIAYNSDRMTASSPSKGMVERSDAATPTKMLSESKSSPALRLVSINSSISNQGITKGAFDNTPYKLISLEEARRQQKPTRSPYAKDQQMVTSTSNQSLDQMSEAKDEVSQPISRHLKNKKSGFLRRFAKEKIDQNDEANHSPDVPVLYNDANEDIVPELRSFNGEQLIPPALSLRPMSSMFNGFAPGMLDTSEPDQKKKKQLYKPTYSSNGQLSPVFTISSHGGNDSSRASSQGLYEDATDQPKFSPRIEVKSKLASRSSADSTQNQSSSLGLIEDFPPTPIPNTLSVAGMDDSTETKARVQKIESKIAKLLDELIQLRRTSSVDKNGEEENSSPASSILSPLMLNDAVNVSCANCGCNCADQKRIQLVNQMATLKTTTNSANTNSSVLSRGRALKPTAIANAGKFGSHTNR